MEIRPVPSTLTPPAPGVDRDPATAPAPAAFPAGSVATAPGTVAVAVAVAGNETDTGLKQAVDRINQSLPPSNQGIEFAIDEDSERVIVKVVDRETREVLRQMPTQEALDIAKALDRTQGLLIKLEA